MNFTFTKLQRHVSNSVSSPQTPPKVNIHLQRLQTLQNQVSDRVAASFQGSIESVESALYRGSAAARHNAAGNVHTATSKHGEHVTEKRGNTWLSQSGMTMHMRGKQA